MILTEKLEIIVKNNLRKYYVDLGYIVPTNRDPKIIIKIGDLPKRSNMKVDCKCDICGAVNQITYDKYNMNIDRCGYYSCRGKCSRMKFYKTNNEKFGVDNPFQNDDIKKKSKITILNRYGVDNVSKLETVKLDKIRKNIIEYGTEYYFNTDDFKNKSRETLKNKYNCIGSVFQNEIIKNKIKETYIRKYNVEYPSQCIDIHRKQQISGFNMKRYKNTEIFYRGKYELDFIEKYSRKTIIQNGKHIKYSNNKIYFSDFYLPTCNLIVEIKSDYYYYKYLEKNLLKQKACLEQGYNFMFIINKNYHEIEDLLNL